MRAIEHIRQPTDYSCTLASIAMATRIPLVKIISIAKSIFSHDPMEIGMNSMDTYNLLVRLGVKFEHIWPVRMEFGNVYIVSVPSLNKEATLHTICIDMQELFTVLDPQKGNPGKKYYDHFEKGDPLAREMRSYAEVIKIN